MRQLLAASLAALATLWAVGGAALEAPPLPPPGLEGAPAPPPASAEELRRPKVKALALERISGDRYRLGDIEISKGGRSLSFPAQVNMNRGLLEYLLVRIGGKTHESLLRTSVEPYHLQFACLLLGLEPTERPLERQGDPATPRGTPVEISISFTGAGGRQASLPADRWVAIGTAEKREPAGKIDWVFTGSAVVNGRFLAQSEGSIVATYHDPVAMIDNASRGGESDKVWFVREGAVPAPGTPVTVTIKKIQ